MRPSVSVRATVIVPTRNRPADLLRCLDAVCAQEGAPAYEVLVVDDGSTPPIAPMPERFAGRVRVLRREGGGPAQARNAAAAEAGGEYLVFTDDDTEVDPAWVAAAVSHLDEHPDAVGVEGPVRSPAWDPLHEYSFRCEGPGAYLTCNVAYRREAFLRVGGFFPDFPFPACEDHDLAFRLLREGPIGFDAAMGIVHHPRRLGFVRLARRGLLAQSDVVLYRRHPERFGTNPLRNVTRSTWYAARFWRRTIAATAPTPWRFLRLLALAGAQVLLTAAGTVRGLIALRG